MKRPWNSPWLFSLNLVMISLFAAVLCCGIYNMAKFRIHKTYSTGLFYVMATVNISCWL